MISTFAGSLTTPQEKIATMAYAKPLVVVIWHKNWNDRLTTVSVFDHHGK